VALALPALARAAAYDVESRTELQADTIAAWSPDSGRALQRRRLVEVLDLAGFEVVAGEDAGLALQLRVDADFSVTEREAAGLDVRRSALQILSGRVHWNGAAGGRIDLEAGRITAQDPVAFFRLDGGRVTVRPVPWLALVAFGGLRVTGASWLGSPAFAPDGVRDSDRLRIGEGLPLLPCPGVPSRQCADATLDDPAPTYGARLSLLRLPGAAFSGADLEVRRTLRAGQVVEERAAGGARWRRGGLGADAGAEWDLVFRRLSALRAGLRWAPLAWLALSAEGIHAHPTYSADSIWNLFDTAPSREARLRADLAPPGWPFRLWAAGGARWVPATDSGRAAFGDQGGVEPFGAAGTAGALGGTSLSADASLRGGLQGTQGWVALVARRALLGWLEVEGRGTLAWMEDPVAPKNGGTFPALAVLLAGRLERRAWLSLLLEDSAPRWERNDLRLFASLALGADWDTRLAR
jgi:hypothetical protein